MRPARAFEIDPMEAMRREADTLGDEDDEPPEATERDEAMVGALCAGGDDLAGLCALTEVWSIERWGDQRANRDTG